MSTAQRVSWKPLPGSTQASLSIAREIARRICDEGIRSEAIQRTLCQSTRLGGRPWVPTSLAEGDVGLALLCAQLDTCFPLEGWDVVAHRFLARAVKAAQEADSLWPSLFGGPSAVPLSGFAFVTGLLSREGTRYSHALDAIEKQLLPVVAALAEQVVQYTEGVLGEIYDVMSGLSGIGTYLLSRQDHAIAREIFHKVLVGLIYLTRKQGDHLLCYTPAHLAPESEWIAMFPGGYTNCGMAHGLPGLLALLALAYRQGVRVEGLEEGIERAADWIIKHEIEDHWGINWPMVIPMNPLEHTSYSAAPSRSGWCYGSPGIAQALWLAGEALDSAAYREEAIEAMSAVFRRPPAERGLKSPTLCHGLAGLLQITLRFACNTRLPIFQEAAMTVLEQVLSLYNPDELLGYRSQELRGNLVDSPGFLDGATGVALALLAASMPQEPCWDRLLLLS